MTVLVKSVQRPLEGLSDISFEVSHNLIIHIRVHKGLEFLQNRVAFSGIKVLRLALQRLELEE